jgi:hypothetical protein
VKAVSEEGRRRLRVVVASRLREDHDHVDRIFWTVWLEKARPLEGCYVTVLEMDRNRVSRGDTDDIVHGMPTMLSRRVLACLGMYFGGLRDR